MTQRFTINRLILIDSYRLGSKIEIKLDGHTSFNGINGAGKTSLLRLIPLFYGESPNKLVQGGGVTQAFVPYYMPHSTSYIIFEYRRRDLTCMVALHASTSGEQVCYRFIDQPFELARFTDSDGNLLNGADLHRHITKRGELCSEQITALSDYRAIIQNTVSKKEHRHLVGRFAFVGAAGRLGHIEKIATGMFSRVTSFRDLRRMVVSCITEANQIVRLETSKTSLTSWIHEFRAYQAVMAEADRMKSLNECALRHEAITRRLSDIHAQMLQLQRQHQQDIADRNAGLDDIDKQMSLVEEEANAGLHRLSTQQGLAEGALRDIEQRITALQTRHQEYAQARIEDLAVWVDAIPDMEAQFNELKVRESALLGKSTHLAGHYSQLKAERSTRFNDDRSALNAQKEPIWKQADTNREALAANAKAAWQAIALTFEAQQERLHAEQSTVTELLGGLKATIHAAQPAQPYVDALEQARAALENALRLREQAERYHADAENAVTQESDLFNAIDAQAEQSLQRERQEQARREHLLSLANASPGTLLHFLREQHPGWTADIARVVPESLLLRDDLAPTFVPGHQATLYGVSIDLSVMDLPRVADELALRSELEVCERAIERAGKEHKAKLLELEAQSRRISEAKVSAQQTLAQRIAADNQVKATQVAKEAAQRALEEDRRQALSTARRNLAEQEGRLAQINTQLANLKQQRLAQQASHEAALTTQQQTVSAQVEVQIRQIDERIAQAKVGQDQALAALDAELATALQAEGVDTQSLDRLKAEMASVKEKLATARANTPEVLRWRLWLQEEWPRHAQLAQGRTLRQAETAQLASEQIRVTTHRNQRHAELDQAKTELNRQLKASEKLLGFVQSRLNQLAPWPADPVKVEGSPGPGISQDVLEAEMDQSLDALRTQRKVARTEVDALTRTLSQRTGTTPFSYYEQTRIKLGPDLGDSAPFAWVEPLRAWFETEHQNVRSLLLNQARTFSQGIHEFHDRLDKFKRQVDTFSRDLQDKMDASIRFRLIQGIAVRLGASFDALDGWDRIKKLDEAYMDWAGLQSNDLPDEVFAVAVEQVNSFLQGRHALEVRLEDLLGIEIDINEIGQPKKTVRDENQLKDASSNGLSYLILCVIFVGLINKIRRDEPVTLVWALDELRDLDLGNVQALLELLDANHIHLVSAFPDPDPDILSRFKNHYTIQEGRKVASFRIAEDAAHV